MIHKQDLHEMKEYKFQERDSVDPRVVVMFCRKLQIAFLSPEQSGIAFGLPSLRYTFKISFLFEI